jgi:hypothetical protein
MTAERLKHHLRSAIPPADVDGPQRDVWPMLASRFESAPRWSYVDVSLAAAVVVVLVMFPEWIWLLAYHL